MKRIMVLLGMCLACGGATGTKQDLSPPPADDGFTGVEEELPPPEDVVPEAGETTEAGDEAPPDVPLADLVLSGVTPGKGAASGGETVSLAGDGFVEGMFVVFDQSASPLVIVTSQKSATALTPPHVPGTVRVIATRPDGMSATLEAAFTYSNQTAVTSVEPDHCPVQGGIPLTVKGAGFHGGAVVLIGGKTCPSIKVVDDSMLVVVAPDGAEGPADVIVNTASGHALLKDGIFYFEEPSITMVNPAAGPATGGTDVELTGTGFYKGVDVEFGGIPGGDTKVEDSHHLTVKAPPYGSSGPVDLSVKTQYGLATLADGFFYFKTGETGPPTKVKMVVPDSGPPAGGNQVAVVASGLSATQTKVTFGPKTAQLVDIKPEAMTATVIVPPGVTGPVDVTVTTPSGKDTLVKGYEYLPAFNVSKVEPGSGPTEGGTKATVWGNGFEEGAVVLFGGLPATGVKWLSGSALSVNTPPGSPGPATVRVAQGAKAAEKKGAFIYVADTGIVAVDPDQGAISGGTLVHVYGANLPGDVKVFFGNNEASHVVVESSTMLSCRTPPGPEGPVDVKIVTKEGKEYAIEDGFTYYDPMALYGGTWGGPTTGTLNVTVIDASGGSVLPDAFVMVWTDPKTPYQGYTGPDGVVTFSGPDLKGQQMVSASKECYNNSSIVAFDATNVTLYLQYICPSQGPPPPGVPLGKVKGKVMGLGKYVIPPPGNCWMKGTAPDGVNCKPCFSGTDAECGGAGNQCLQIADYGQFCTTPCTKPADCPDGYVCTGTKLGTVQCLPQPGQKTAYCKSTIDNIFAEEVPPGSGSQVDADMKYAIDVRPGTIAVICLGGITDPETQLFMPYAMGVKRHLSVQPGQVIEDVNILLDVQMDRSFRVYFDDPPQGVPGPNINYMVVYYDFGVDGVFQQTWGSPYTFGQPQVMVDAQPRAFTGNLYDVTFTFLAGAFTLVGTNASTPFSISLHQGVTDLADDSMFRLDGSTWSVVKTGVRKDILGMWGQAYNDVFAVGQDGLVYYYDGFGFTQQPVPGADKNLRAMHGAVKDDAWAVGEGGLFLHFTDKGWSKVDVPEAKNQNLYAVTCPAKDDCFAVGSWGFGMHWDGKAWTKLAGMPGLEFYGLAPTGSGKAVAVGMSGQVARLTPGFVTAESSGIWQTLRAVTVTKSGEIWAVGDQGTMLRWTDGQWGVVPSGTSRNLWAVAAQGKSIFAFGDAGQIVRVEDGVATPSRIEGYAPHLRASFADPAGGSPVVAMGVSQMMVGPFLQVPEMVHPKDGELMKDLYVEFKAKPGIPAQAHYIMIAIPGLFGDIPVWEMIISGDTFKVDLPDFENIEGTPGIPKGQFLKLTTLRINKPDFKMENFDYMDLSPFDQKGWAANVTMFQRE